MRYQLRIYTALPGRVHDFAREWAEQVVPLRRQFGFDVVGGWVTEDETRFVWIVGHEDFEAADRAYYESPEREGMEPDPRRHLDLDRVEIAFMQSVPMD
jgi:hypothetical protein